jgi:two-component system sensor histidine kinase CreC
MRLIIVAAGSIGMIVFVSFIAARLVRSRTAGMSIRMQIFLALGLIVGAFAFGLGLMVLDRVKERADLVGEEAARGEAHTIAAMVSAEIEGGRSLADVATMLEGASLHVTLFDENGNTVFSSGRASDAPGSVAASAPITVAGKEVGRARVLKPTLEIQQTLADFAPTVLIISLLLGAVAAGAAALIGRTIAQPIETLTRYAQRVSGGDRRAPPPLGHGREVMRLSKSLDSMRRQLEGRLFVETFAADLSHELKNPVAAIRASGEVLRDGALDEPDEATRFVGRILEATTRIESLLGDLLSLARLEARGVDDAATLIDLGEQAELVLAAARDAGADVQLDVAGNVAVRGEAEWLSRAIRYMVDTARIHGEGGPILVNVSRNGGDVCCSVVNAGQVAPAVHRRLFRRFVTTRADRGGTGLGLSIVRAVAEAHGGQASCVSEGPPEVAFQITLPSA